MNTQTPLMAFNWHLAEASDWQLVSDGDDDGGDDGDDGVDGVDGVDGMLQLPVTIQIYKITKQIMMMVTMLAVMMLIVMMFMISMMICMTLIVMYDDCYE